MIWSQIRLILLLSFLCHRVQSAVNFEDCGTLECADDDAGPSCKRTKVQDPPIHPLISGGKLAEENQFPWMAFIIKFDEEEQEEGGSDFCGGTIVGSRWILTSRHCVETNGDYDVGVGSGDEGKQKKLAVKGIYKYPIWESWVLPGADMDIALLELAEPLEFRREVRRICLPRHYRIRKWDTAIVAGWGTRFWDEHGTMEEEPGPTPLLHYGQILLGTHPFYRSENPVKCAPHSNPWYFCGVGDTEEMKWTATGEGDSGGPVVVKRMLDVSTNIAIHYQIGIVSAGDKMMEEFEPKGQLRADFCSYLAVDHFCEWILLTTRREVACEDVRGLHMKM